MDKRSRDGFELREREGARVTRGARTHRSDRQTDRYTGTGIQADMPGRTTGWELSMENLHIWANKTRGPAGPVPCPTKAARVHLWSLSLGPLPFSLQVRHTQPTSMQQPADRPRSVVKGPRGRGKRRGGAGGLRWYPECTQKAVPALPVPTGAKQRSHNLMPITHIYIHTYMQLALGIKGNCFISSPGRGRRGPT